MTDPNALSQKQINLSQFQKKSFGIESISMNGVSLSLYAVVPKKENFREIFTFSLFLGTTAKVMTQKVNRVRRKQ